MDALLIELGKYGLAGVLCGLIAGIAILLLRHLLSRADRIDADMQKSTNEALSLLRSQMNERAADLSWARATITGNQTEFLAALRSEREARERQTAALLQLLAEDHKEAMTKLDEIKEEIAALAEKR